MTKKEIKETVKEKVESKESITTGKKKKSSVKKWVVIGFLVLISFLGFRFLSFRKQMADREVMEIQRQVMIDSWKEQGLSDEDVEEKLKEFRRRDFMGKVDKVVH